VTGKPVPIVARAAPGVGLELVAIGAQHCADSFSFALRAELNETAVPVTCLMLGATEALGPAGHGAVRD
jgi:hypothetical protein